MCTVFLDRNGVSAYGRLAQSSTFNSDVYHKTLWKLHCVIQNNQWRMLIQVIVLIHDNVRPHTSIEMQHLLAIFGWE